jgi:WD40 repeat protein
LFAANYRANTISRFVFDENGTAVPNGVIAVTDSDYLIGVAFSPSGELFANDIGKINRFLFDDTGAAIPNGSFTVPLDNPGYIAFSPDGEMFVASHDNDTIFRFLFDADGNPYSNGTISVHGPLGFAFTPTGEMIVTSHGFLSTIYDPDFGQISRFLFDSDGNAIPNGILTTPSLGQPAIYEWSVPEPGTFALFSLALAGLGVASRVRAIQSRRAARCRAPGRCPV